LIEQASSFGIALTISNLFAWRVNPAFCKKNPFKENQVRKRAEDQVWKYYPKVAAKHLPTQ
jgi:hypothetical protein